MKNLLLKVLQNCFRMMSDDMRFQFAHKQLSELSKKQGANSHVGVRRKIYKSFLRLYPVNYSYEFGRTYGLFKTVEGLRNVEGDIVEFGVGNGKSMFTWASALKFFGIEKTIYGFDSFEGFPAAHEKDLGTRVIELTDKVAGWTHIHGPDYITNWFEQDDSLDGMTSLFNDGIPDIRLIKGYFDQTINQVPNKIALLHLDADMYESTLIPLQKCVSLMSKGGMIIFDEYHEFERWPGVKKATDEVCSPLGLKAEFDFNLSRYVIRF